MQSNDTIFALSSGTPPAAIAVIRVSGVQASQALVGLAGALPRPRLAAYRALCDPAGAVLDQSLVLWLPGPRTATGEDMAEFHLHGGRAVVSAVLAALAVLGGLRPAEPGEFTRRAFANGRIDLAEAEGLADLLSAETELQRRQAISLASGALSAQVSAWRERVLAASAAIEAVLDFGDEDDVAQLPIFFREGLGHLAGEIEAALSAPRAEVLREGYRVALAGPPNSGKSTLFNCLVEDDAAITAPIAGTTRDVLTRPVALAGVPFVFTDTAGLRDHAADSIEAIGIERAYRELERADLVLWLGPEGCGRGRTVWEIESFSDLGQAPAKSAAAYRVSGSTGAGIQRLRDALLQQARRVLPIPGSVALNRRQHELLAIATAAIAESEVQADPLLVAESLREARVAFDRLLGRAATEDMLDTLFARFCIGK